MNKTVLNRRFFLSSLVSAAAVSLSMPAYAQSVLNDMLAAPGRGQWDDAFDVQIKGRQQVATNLPIMSPQTVSYLEAAIGRYAQIVQDGGWQQVQGPLKLKVGTVDPAVAGIRQRLIISGDLDRGAGLSNSYDSYVEAAVKRFQVRHGLPADGVMGELTYAAMNVSAAVRLGQLQTNLRRLIDLSKVNHPRFVMVNIPAAQIEANENGRVAQRHTAVVGKIDRQSPILTSKIHEVILNPYWTAPKSIIQKDIIPLMRKDPQYLTENKIRLYNGRGEEVAPETVDWTTDEAVKLMFRQDPGKINAMASTKINFHNSHAVYMHDTPQQSTFNNLMRFDSSGCVRVQNVRDLDVWLLKNTPGWDRQTIEDVIKSRENRPIQLADPVPVYFVYISAWSTGDGVVQFRDDIYKMDGAAELAIGTDS